MPLSPAQLAQLAQLKTEITTDPAAIGYAAHMTSGNDGELAKLLNLPRGASVTRNIVTSNQLLSTVTATEYAALTVTQRDLWQAILTATANTGVPLSDPQIRSQLGAVWGPATATRAAITALQTNTNASRAEFLGFGQLSPQDIADARR